MLSACSPADGTAVATATAVPPPVPTQPACRELEPTPAPAVKSAFPEISASDWSRGPEEAATTILIYNDFQCAECNESMLIQLAEKFPEDVRLVYRHFPQADRYDKAYPAAQAAEAAGRQGKFWEMHDILFEKQAEWVNLSPDEFKSWVAKEAEAIGIDRATI